MSETFTFYIQPWYRKSPYFEATKRAGCRSWGLYNHMLLPTLYDDPVTEYWALLNDVTMWDVAVERCVEITGPDAFEFTNLLTCRDLTTCAVGQCKYVLLTARRGGIVNDPVLLRIEEDRFWLALADSDALLYAKGVAAFAGMDVDIEEADVSPMQIQGPRSKDVIRALFGDEIADLRLLPVRRDRGRTASRSSSRAPAGRERSGYELYLRDASRGDELWRLVEEAGAPVRHPRDRAVGGAADRGGHLQLRLGHAPGGHAVPHHRARAVGRARPGGRLHREGRAAADRGGGGRPASSSGSTSAARR